MSGVVRAVLRLCVLDPGIRLTTKEKSMGKTSVCVGEISIWASFIVRHGQLLAGSHDKNLDTGPDMYALRDQGQQSASIGI
jgi:hypothetical protein